MARHDVNRTGDRSRRPDHGRERMRFNFLSDRRLRFLVYTIALVVGVFLFVMFELPALFGMAFIAWWAVWSLQRDAADLYYELYDINEMLAASATGDTGKEDTGR